MMIADFEGDKEEYLKYDKILKSVDSYLISLNPPSDFSEKSQYNSIRQMELSFERLMASLESSGVSNPKKLTVFELNSKIDFIESKNKKK